MNDAEKVLEFLRKHGWQKGGKHPGCSSFARGSGHCVLGALEHVWHKEQVGYEFPCDVVWRENIYAEVENTPFGKAMMAVITEQHPEMGGEELSSISYFNDSYPWPDIERLLEKTAQRMEEVHD